MKRRWIMAGLLALGAGIWLESGLLAQEPEAGETPQTVESQTAGSEAAESEASEAQPPEAQEVPRPDEVYTEQIDVRLVRMPILAKDRRNRPITDLKVEEIIVKEGRQKLQVAFLDPFTPAPSDEPLPEVKLSVDLPGGGDEVVNSVGREMRNIVFFIDVENDQKVAKAKAAADLVRFVELGLDDDFRVAVLSFNGTVHLEQGFTSNRRDAGRAIQRAFDRPPRPGVTMERRIRELISRLEDCIIDSNQFTNTPDTTCLRAVAYEYADENRPRSRDFLEALEGLIQYVGGLDGHKSVVAVSHGVPADHGAVVAEAIKAVFGYIDELNFIEIDLRTGEGVQDQLVDTMNMALENRVTLHFIDRTLATSSDYGAQVGYLYQFGARPFLTAFEAPHKDLGQISATTGGIFLNMIDLYDGAKQVMDLERGGYMLGFYTERFLRPERLAKVSVKTTRPGVNLVHRRGTYGRKIEHHPQLGIRSEIVLGQPVKGGTTFSEKRLKVPFEVVIEPEDLGYRVAKEFSEVTFTLHLVLSDERGRTLADTYHLVNHSYPASVWATEEMEPVIVSGWAELPEGLFRLVSRVRNPKLDLEGRAEQPLRIQVGSREDAARQAGESAGDSGTP